MVGRHRKPPGQDLDLSGHFRSDSHSGEAPKTIWRERGGVVVFSIDPHSGEAPKTIWTGRGLEWPFLDDVHVGGRHPKPHGQGAAQGCRF